jgi:uncharacterized membrane protein
LAIQSNRTFGGIGAILTVIGAVSSVSSLIRYAYPNSTAANLAFSVVSSLFGFAAFIGFILFLIAMYGFSRDYGEHKIFNYILYGIIYTIVAAVIVGIIAIAVVIANIIPTLNTSTSPTQIQDMTLTYLSPVFAAIGIVALIYIVFIVKAFNLLGDKSQVPLFRTAAKVLLAGGLVTTVIGIIFAVLAAFGSLSLESLAIIAVPGGLVQDVAWVLLAMAFFRIKAPPPQTFTPTYVQTAPVQVKYCPNCGTPNQTDTLYCTHCGQKL